MINQERRPHSRAIVNPLTPRRETKLRVALFGLWLAAGVLAGTPGDACPPGGMFRLGVPELQLDVQEDATAALPHRFVRRLLLRVLRGAQEIPPGKIYVNINGEAANTIMTPRSVGAETVCELDLYFRPGFLLHSGRNSVEAWAQSIYGRPYYASFLLDVRDGPASLREIQVETSVTSPGERPPLIQLLQPQGPVEMENVRGLTLQRPAQAKPRSRRNGQAANDNAVTLQGYVEGGVGSVTLTAQGKPVPLSPGALASGKRGLTLELGAKPYSFDTSVKVAPDQDAIEVMAADGHNNRTRLLIPVVQGTRETEERYAVVIGVSRYRDPRLRLQFADRDAQAVYDFLLDPKGGGLRRENVRYLLNDDATAASIRTALFNFLTHPGSNDLAIVYFAGHGAPDPQSPQNLYLLGYDTDVDNMGGTALRMRELEEAFDHTIHASVITLVDACHSAGIGQDLPNLANQGWTRLSHRPARAVITASDIDQFSAEGAQWGGGHGVFTYFVLQGLEGAADANRDHRISVGELFDYVRSHVSQETGGVQTPTALAGLTRGIVLTQAAARAGSVAGR
jgi:hypothetical protein